MSRNSPSSTSASSPSPSVSPHPFTSIPLSIPDLKNLNEDHFIYKPPNVVNPRFPSHLKINVLNSGLLNNSDDEDDSHMPTNVPSNPRPPTPVSSSTPADSSKPASVLGDPLTFHPTPPNVISPSKVSFERITQLPTPVIGSGQFSYNYNLHSSSNDHGYPILDRSNKKSPRNTLKSNDKDLVLSLNDSPMPSPPRVISDYKPIPALGRKNSLLENSATNSKKRFVSNPVQTSPLQSNFTHQNKTAQVSRSSSKSSTHSSPLTPSPPLTSASSIISPATSHSHSSSTYLPQTSPNNRIHINKNDTLTENLSKYSGDMFYSEKLGQKFSFVEEIGTGNFSTVVLAKSIIDTVAIKIITIPTKYKNEVSNFKSFIKRELNILYQLNHPCIIKLIDYNINLQIKRSQIESDLIIDSETEIHSEKDYAASEFSTPISGTDEEFELLQHSSDQLIFLNYCPGGNLFQFLSNHNKQPDNLAYWIAIRRIVCETITAISYMHSKNIIHRDIKLENVLLNYDYNDILNYAHDFSGPFVNITDFGLSKKLKTEDQLLSTRCGSQDYIPPELLMGLKYNGKLTDSWSVGVLIYSILEDRLPFDLPPLSVLQSSGVSPAVIRRKLSKNNSAHRIAMIDWDWFKLNDYLCDEEIGLEVKQIMSDLKNLVDVLLVRKDKRLSMEHILQREEFQWIKTCVPASFYQF